MGNGPNLNLLGHAFDSLIIMTLEDNTVMCRKFGVARELLAPAESYHKITAIVMHVLSNSEVYT